MSRRAALRAAVAAAVSGHSLLGRTAPGRAEVAVPVVSGPPQELGRWTAPVPGPEPVIAVHAVLLHTGEVLMVEGTTGYVWNPVTGEHGRTDPPDNLFCSGHTLLDDGDVLFVGGHLGGDENLGPPWNYTFRPSTRTWTRRQDSARGRWYPTTTLLPDGRCLITGGTDEATEPNTALDVYRDGRITTVGHQKLEFYPLQHVMPDGRILAVAPDEVGSTYGLDPSDFSVSRLPAMGLPRAYAATVLLPGGASGSTRVLVVGGRTHTAVPHDSTQVFDTAHPGRGWQPRAPLPQPRSFTNVVLLPDGRLLAVGGTNDNGPQRQTLLYDPALDVWRGLATQAEARSYHSTALLLPDGRVLSAGDNLIPPGGGDQLELFSPPYLFRGPRPAITRAPEEAVAGGVLFLGADVEVTRAVLVRPGATTHSFDMSQRHVELAVRPASGGLRARLPGPQVALPGWYMLFVLNSAGVPSVARWIRIRGVGTPG